MIIVFEIHKNENRNIDFKFVNYDNRAQEIKIENAINYIEESYNIFFDNVEKLHNKNDFKDFWNYGSYDGFFNVFNYVFQAIKIDGKNSENFNLLENFEIDDLVWAYNERIPDQNISFEYGMRNPLYEGEERSLNG